MRIQIVKPGRRVRQSLGIAFGSAYERAMPVPLWYKEESEQVN